MPKKSFLSAIASSFLSSKMPPSTVVQQAMTPLSEAEISAVAGGPQVINDPEGAT